MTQTIFQFGWFLTWKLHFCKFGIAFYFLYQWRGKTKNRFFKRLPSLKLLEVVDCGFGAIFNLIYFFFLKVSIVELPFVSSICNSSLAEIKTIIAFCKKFQFWRIFWRRISDFWSDFGWFDSYGCAIYYKAEHVCTEKQQYQNIRHPHRDLLSIDFSQIFQSFWKHSG